MLRFGMPPCHAQQAAEVKAGREVDEFRRGQRLHLFGQKGQNAVARGLRRFFGKVGMDFMKPFRAGFRKMGEASPPFFYLRFQSANFLISRRIRKQLIVNDARLLQVKSAKHIGGVIAEDGCAIVNEQIELHVVALIKQVCRQILLS